MSGQHSGKRKEEEKNNKIGTTRREAYRCNSFSDTTRSPRPGEIQGVSYHFVEKSQFEQLIEQGAFLEYAQFGGNYYGTSAKAVEEVSQPGEKGERRRALLDIDTQVRTIVL